MRNENTNLNNDDIKIVRSTAAFDCGGRCPIKFHVKDSKIIRIDGDDLVGEENQLRTCVKCRALRQHIYHPERLRYPLKRVGPKGEGKFERISWDEALNEIAEKIKYTIENYGNEAIFLPFGGGYLGALHNGLPAMVRLFTHLGGYSSNHGNVSSEGCVWATQATYGSPFVGHSRDDMLNSKLIILWGWDPARMNSGTDAMYNLVKAHEKGAKVISINPRYSDTDVVVADTWIPIIPGTDVAIMAAMANIILKENLQDQAFLDKYTFGFDKYRDYVMGQEDGIEKTPEWAEKICQVPAEMIRELAREYATTKPAALMDCQGPARSAMGGQYNRGAITLSAMTGNIGKHGGSACGGLMGIPIAHMFFGPFILPPSRNPVEENHPNKVSVRGSVNLTHRLITRVHTNKMFDQILEGKKGGYPYDIKFGWFCNNNFLNQLGNSNHNAKALKKLEYMVSAELFMTPTARYADIILPVTSFAERSDLTRPWPSGPYFGFMNRAIEPVGECKSDLEIAELLADKLGIEKFSKTNEERQLKKFWRNTRDIKKYITDYDKYKEDGIWRVELDEPYVAFKKQIEDPENNPFNTPSGKIEIYSQKVAEVNDPNMAPIPKYIHIWEGKFDPLTEKYPLQMISPHPKNRVHSELYHVEWLKEVDPHKCWINSVDAESRGIKTGDLIYVHNDRGIISIEAWVTERIIPGVISIHEGAWYTPDEEGIDRGGCVNTLTKNAYGLDGASCLKNCLVQVSKEKPEVN
ncbi:MAG: molybdopterin-dependent oxidoreductase [Promethearchaeota archaeon]